MAYFVFGDESGRLANAQDRYAVVAAVGSENARQFEHLIKNVRAWLQQRGKQFQNHGELRFHTAGDATRLRLMKMIAEAKIDVYLFILEKEAAIIPDSPDNYALMLLPIIREILAQYSDATFAFDRHFTRLAQQERVKSVLESLVNRKLDFEQRDSQKSSGLQVADFVAGAALAKYQREEDEYLNLVRERIVMEHWSSWGK